MNLKVYTCLSKHTQPYQLFLHRHCFELSGGYIASQVSPPLSQGRGDKHCGVFGMDWVRKASYVFQERAWSILKFITKNYVLPFSVCSMPKSYKKIHGSIFFLFPVTLVVILTFKSIMTSCMSMSMRFITADSLRGL